MKQDELARELAREAGVPAATAHDQVDEVIHRIVKKLRRGQRVELRGIGKLIPRSSSEPRTTLKTAVRSGQAARRGSR